MWMKSPPRLELTRKRFLKRCSENRAELYVIGTPLHNIFSNPMPTTRLPRTFIALPRRLITNAVKHGHAAPSSLH